MPPPTFTTLFTTLFAAFLAPFMAFLTPPFASTSPLEASLQPLQPPELALILPQRIGRRHGSEQSTEKTKGQAHPQSQLEKKLGYHEAPSPF
jgi:hypothetical protein